MGSQGRRRSHGWMVGSRDRWCEGRLGRAVWISVGVWNAVSGRPVGFCGFQGFSDHGEGDDLEIHFLGLVFFWVQG